MHFEILVEDQSGKKALDVLVRKIIGNEHTCRVISYKGLGAIPRRMSSPDDASKRLLLSRLPQLLQGYGKAWKEYPAAVFVVCDLDDKCLSAFCGELADILNACNPKPLTRFCIAIEEGEAWLLGDIPAIKSAYPKAKDAALSGYVQDSICGTWERLADAIYSGGAAVLSKKGWQAVGTEKSRWAENISPKMDVDKNNSPSFIHFRDKLRELSGKR